MNDYMGINWKENPLEEDEEFISADVLKSSYLTRFTGGDLSFIKEKVIIEEPAKRGRPCVPKVPGCTYQLNISKLSRLNTIEHETLIRALKIITSGRTNLSIHDKKDLELYNNSKPIIIEENGIFLTFAECNWMKTLGKKPLKIKPALKQYATFRHLERTKSIKKMPSFFKSVDLVSFSYTENEIPVEMVHTANVLDVGKVAKYLPPTMTEPFFFKANTLPGIEEITTNSQMAVSEDKNIDSILETHDVDLVISFSALKRLINFTEVSEKWDIPLVIKEVKKPNGSVKKIILLDKPLPKLEPTLLDINEKCAKIFTRTNFCSIEGFAYTSEDIPISNPERTTGLDNTTEECMAEIDNKSDCGESVKSGDFEDLFSEDEDEVPTVKRKILRNAFYKLWRLSQKEEGSTLIKRKMVSKVFNVLIRGKIDACELNQNGSLQAVTIVPKMEYQLQFGAATFTKTELAKQWTILYFKPYSNLYRVRTQYHKSEVVKIEPCNIQKVSNEATSQYNMKPHLGLGVIYKMAYEMMKFAPGKYLLHHEHKHGSFAALYHESPEESSDFNLHRMYEEESKIVENYVKPWSPIDLNVLLPLHEEKQRMPGLFKPCFAAQKVGYKNWKNKGVKKPYKKKKNKKKKAKNVVKAVI